MKISPLEIEQQTFNKALRGFDTVEVSTYLGMLAGEFESLIAENAELKDKIKELTARLKSYQELEQTLQNTLLTTQKTAEESKRNVQKEADLIIQEAHLRSEKMLEDAKLQLADLNKQISNLQMSKESCLSEFKALLNAQWHLLENIESGVDQSKGRTTIKRRRVRPRGEELEKILDTLEEGDSSQEAGSGEES
jgi:cell division initiation protein